jgi:cell division protein FtsL
VPLAVGRATVAVGDLADSGLVQRLTRGRLWIGALTTLLVGIVALNVMALSLNASTSKVAAQADELKRSNSALRAQVAGELSNERVQRIAARLGLLVPDPAAILYLRPGADDAQVAARRLASGELAGAALSAPVLIPVAPVAPAPTAETTAETPAATVPDTTDPAAPAEATPTVPPAVGAPAAGGVGAP